MVEGAASLMTSAYGGLAAGTFREDRETNRLDGGCHHYNVYETSDGEHICIGTNEPKFYAVMLDIVGLGDADLPEQTGRKKWPEMRTKLAAIFKTKTREQWTGLMEQKEICYAPVLRMSEAFLHPQNVHRGSFIEVAGVTQPGPAPKFARRPGTPPRDPAHAGEHTAEGLADWGIPEAEIAALLRSGAARQG